MIKQNLFNPVLNPHLFNLRNTTVCVPLKKERLIYSTKCAWKIGLRR